MAYDRCMVLDTNGMDDLCDDTSWMASDFAVCVGRDNSMES